MNTWDYEDPRETDAFYEKMEEIIAERFKDLDGYFFESFCQYQTDEEMAHFRDLVLAVDSFRDTGQEFGQDAAYAKAKVGAWIYEQVVAHMFPKDEDVLEEMDNE